MLELLCGAAVVGLLVAPGSWLARAARLPCPLLAGFLAGAVALSSVVFLLQVTGAGLSTLKLGAAWVVVAGLAVAGAPRLRAGRDDDDRANAEPWPPRMIALVGVAATPLLAVLAWRATAHPLFGVDTGFRWGHLAALMWRESSLDFYPPVTPAHYERYVWPDGIPPLVSSLYYSCHALAGHVAPRATAPVVLAQFALLLAATAALARRLFSPAAGGYALALLAVSPVAGWAATMGHETGLTALSLIGILLYLPARREEESTAAMLAAGLAAAVGALAREYGWAFVVFGCGLAWRRGLSARGLGVFIAAAVLGAAPWYARNAVLTGNFLFNHSLGFLPVNSAHARLMALYRESYGLWAQLREAPELIVTAAAAALATGLAGAVRFGRTHFSLVAAAALGIALWAVSVPSTAAGLANSLRVLTPALAVGAVLGGAWCARWLRAPPAAVVFVAFGLLGTDAALRALTLPNDTYRLPPDRWLEADRAVESFRDRPAYHELAQRTAGSRVLALGPNVYLAPLGMEVVPPWSPDVAFLFDPRVPARAARDRLRAAGIRYLLVAKGRLNQAYLAQCPALAEASPAEMTLVLERDNLLLFAFPATEPAPR